MVKVDTEFRLGVYYIGGNDRINAVSSPIWCFEKCNLYLEYKSTPKKV